jgi:hypothetical protein
VSLITQTAAAALLRWHSFAFAWPARSAGIDSIPWGVTAMISLFGQRVSVYALAICLSVLPVLQSANAAIVPTGAAIEIADRQQQIERIDAVLARENVQSLLVDLGVDPVDASARVRALTDAELATLDEQLAELPAGGVGFVELVGIVAIVLIVLELLGVTNIFSKI